MGLKHNKTTNKVFELKVGCTTQKDTSNCRKFNDPVGNGNTVDTEVNNEEGEEERIQHYGEVKIQRTFNARFIRKYFALRQGGSR